MNSFVAAMEAERDLEGMQTIRIALCENDEKDLEVLKTIVGEAMEGYNLPYDIYDFKGGEALLGTELDFHLVFLDIMMEGVSGMEVGREIYRRNRRIKIIFQTNYGQFCKDAVNFSHAFAYLEKPLARQEVENHIEAFMESGGLSEARATFHRAIPIRDGKQETKQTVSLPVKDILYIQNLKGQKKVRIVTGDAQYICREPLDSLADKMESFGFGISCRGMLVNFENIRCIRGYEVQMKNGDEIPLSQKRSPEFRRKMNYYLHYYGDGR